MVQCPFWSNLRFYELQTSDMMEGRSSPWTHFWIEGASGAPCGKAWRIGDGLVAFFGKTIYAVCPWAAPRFTSTYKVHHSPGPLLSHPAGASASGQDPVFLLWARVNETPQVQLLECLPLSLAIHKLMTQRTYSPHTQHTVMG